MLEMLNLIWNNWRAQTARKGSPLPSPVPSSNHAPRARRLQYETLEARVVPAVNLFINFGDGSANHSFHERLVDLTTAQGISPFTGAEEATIQTAIRNTLNSTYQPYGVSFVETNPGTSIDTVILGDKPGVGNSGTPGDRLWATADWRNFQYLTQNIFPSEFVNIAPAGSSRTQIVSSLANALSYYTATAAGQALGVQTAAAYGDPSIMPESYARIPKILNSLSNSNSHTIQNSHFGSSTALGLSDLEFVDGTKFTLSPLQKISLEYANRLIASSTEILSETNAAHQSVATAQPLAWQALPLSGSNSALLSLGNIAPIGATSATEKDYYSFAASAGEILTLSLHSSDSYQFGIDSSIRLIGTDGVTPLATSDDTYLGSNSFAQITTLKDSTDSLLVNLPISTSGTYYVEVSSKTTDGLYDLVLAKWSPVTTPWKNPGNPLNVDNSLGAKPITPLDALIVINYLNSHAGSSGHLPNPPIGAENPVIDSSQGAYAYIDTNGDNSATPLDALIVINALNSQAAAGGEANGEAWPEAPLVLTVKLATEIGATENQDAGLLLDQTAQETLFALYGTPASDLLLNPATGRRR